MMRPHTVALIPARAGSKRLPGKNERVLGGRPLLEWTVAAAVKSACFDAVVLSTDSERLAAIGRRSGAIVPWLRPAELATDQATSVAVCQHALDSYEREVGRVSTLVLLQPTSPFRRVLTIRNALACYAEAGGASVVSVSPAAVQPSWLRTVGPDQIIRGYPGIPVDIPHEAQTPAAWYLNGLIYVAGADAIRQGSFYTAQTRAFRVMDRIEAIDIDTEFDWMMAEAALPTVRARNEADE